MIRVKPSIVEMNFVNDSDIGNNAITLDVEPAIEIRKTASTSSGGCQLRREEVVLLIKKLGYEGWKRVKDAGSRKWNAEIVFSSIKGLLGEDLLSRKFSTQKVEAG